MSKLKIVKDGKVQGSFISLCTTFVIFILIFLGAFISLVCDNLVKMEGLITKIYITSLLIWLGYKALTKESDAGKSTVIERIVEKFFKKGGG